MLLLRCTIRVAAAADADLCSCSLSSARGPVDDAHEEVLT